MDLQSSSPIDLEQLNQISEGDLEFEIEILQVYVEDILLRIEQIREAIAISDRSQIAKSAHHIKGSSGNVGALKMQALAIQMEEQERVSEEFLEIFNSMLQEIQAIELFISKKSSQN